MREAGDFQRTTHLHGIISMQKVIGAALRYAEQQIEIAEKAVDFPASFRP